MTLLDYAALVVLAASLVFGGARGILKGVISIISALIGLVAAEYLHHDAGRQLSFLTTGREADLLGFTAIFLAVVLTGAFISYRLRRRLYRARLGWLDHLFGAGFGLVRGWMICSVAYMALTAFPVKIEAVEQAKFAPALLEGARVIAYLTSSEMRERFQRGYAEVQRFWRES